MSDRTPTAPGHLVNGTFSLPSGLQARRHRARPATGGAFSDVGANPATLLTYAGPVSQ